MNGQKKNSLQWNSFYASRTHEPPMTNNGIWKIKSRTKQVLFKEILYGAFITLNSFIEKKT